MRIIGLALLAACIPAYARAQATPSADSAIRAHTAAYAAAVNKRDGAAVAALFAPDADLVINDGPRVVGRGAIREVTQKDLATWPVSRRVGFTVTGVRMPTKDIAIVETAETFSQGPVLTIRGTTVLVRRDGKWLVSALRIFPAAKLE